MSENISEKRRAFRARLKLSQKFLVGFLILAIALCACLCWQGYRRFKSYFFNSYSDKALAAAWTASDLVDGDMIVKYLDEINSGSIPDISSDAHYNDVMQKLSFVKERADMLYVYVFYPSDDGYLYIYDAMTSKEAADDVCAIGVIEPYVGTTVRIDNTFATGKAVEDMIVTRSEGQGYVGTVFVPVFDSAGKIVALVGVDVEMTEVDSQLRDYLTVTIGTTALIVFALVFLFLLYINKGVVKPIRKLTGSVDNYINGDKLDYKAVNIRTGDELETLSDSFAKMAKDMNIYMDNLQRATADKQRIATELDMATNIQMSMLPSIFPPFPDCKDFDIFARLTPAKEVGGDFYDFFRVDEDRLCFLVADVSGKGVPAALFMMIAKALIKNQAQSDATISKAFTIANSQLAENNDTSMFVTALMMMLDTKKHTMSICNAGHNLPLIRRAGGEFEYLQLRAGCPLASIDGVRYKEIEIEFNKGDEIFLYTDGVTEALNEKLELYSDPRLLDTLNSLKNPDTELVADMVNLVYQNVKDYAGNAPQADDITMLMLKCNK